MSKINILPQSVAELIAAGEVVDRPSSIVKELVENAIDAGASRISIEIKNGGVSYIRVSDNGSGIAKEDLPLAFIRHATSKITERLDLDAISTLGFRGEALPSIAAVSRVKVTTRTADQAVGSCYIIDGSGQAEQTDCGCAVGTVIEVRDLFYNTPARMKFLKKDVTESNAVASLIDRLALANPSVAFDFLRDGKRALQTPGDGKLFSAVRIVCGAEVASGMIPVDYTGEGISVKGLISRPSVSRTTRSLQTFFINSRYVRSKTCAAAVEEAYKNRMMTGRFPACIIDLKIDCSLVDVNVHPAKLEVRFSDERSVYNTVYRACMQTLSESEQKQITPVKKINYFTLSDFDYSDRQISLDKAASQKQQSNTLTAMLGSMPASTYNASSLTMRDTTNTFNKTISKPVKSENITDGKHVLPPSRTNKRMLDIERGDEILDEAPVVVEHIKVQKDTTPIKADADLDIKTPAIEECPITESFEQPCMEIAAEDTKPAEPEPYRIIGELFDTYILIEQGSNFVLIDKHAAHERYIYNSIRHLEKESDNQILLSPQAISLARDEYFALNENPQALESLGIVAEDFGEGTILVREVPMILEGFPLQQLLGEVAANVMTHKNSVTPEFLDELMYSVSCRAAVMAGKKSSMPELKVLADMVLAPDGVRYCPHGRPVMTTFTKREVEKMFGRIG